MQKGKVGHQTLFRIFLFVIILSVLSASVVNLIPLNAKRYETAHLARVQRPPQRIRG